MEPGKPPEPREPREPRPGAETAAVPRWEEAKTFYDNLAPKKKPKSVNAGRGYGGRARERSPGRSHKPPGEGPVAPLRKGTQPLSTKMRPAVGAGSCLFWEFCSGVFFPGLGFHARIPLPHAATRAQLGARGSGPPRAGCLVRAGSTCWQSRLGAPAETPGAPVTRLWKPGSSLRPPGFRHLGTGLRTQASAFTGSGSQPCVLGLGLCSLCPTACAQDSAPLVSGSQRWALRPSSGLCCSSSGHQHLCYSRVVSAPRDSHRGERSSPHRTSS